METPLKSLGIDLPIIQAPMAGAQGPTLALAVCDAGGLGSLPCAMLTAQQMGVQLYEMRQQAQRPYNVNFFCHTPPEPDPTREAAWRGALAPYYAEFGIEFPSAVTGPQRSPFNDAAAQVLEEFHPPVVSFHFGLPNESLLSRVRATGAFVLATATTVEEAIWLESRGVDAIIAQGLEAGGHRGMLLTEDLSTQMGTFALVPQVIRAVRVPVIAAGGIADAAGVAAALSLGACAVQVGTAYLTCSEATTSTLHRAALLDPASRHTAVTRLFSGRPARGIVNRLIRDLGAMSELAPAFPLASALLAPLRGRAESVGDTGFSPLWCGQNASGCAEIPAAELTRRLVE